MIEEAVVTYAVSWLGEHGGDTTEGIRAAVDAIHYTANKYPFYHEAQFQDRLLQLSAGRRVRLAIDKIQDRVRDTIYEGRRWWISSGSTTVWHAVATTSRALCGREINHGERAWKLRKETPAFLLCRRCAKLTGAPEAATARAPGPMSNDYKPETWKVGRYRRFPTKAVASAEWTGAQYHRMPVRHPRRGISDWAWAWFRPWR